MDICTLYIYIFCFMFFKSLAMAKPSRHCRMSRNQDAYQHVYFAIHAKHNNNESRSKFSSFRVLFFCWIWAFLLFFFHSLKTCILRWNALKICIQLVCLTHGLYYRFVFARGIWAVYTISCCLYGVLMCIHNFFSPSFLLIHVQGAIVFSYSILHFRIFFFACQTCKYIHVCNISISVHIVYIIAVHADLTMLIS